MDRRTYLIWLLSLAGALAIGGCDDGTTIVLPDPGCPRPEEQLMNEHGLCECIDEAREVDVDTGECLPVGEPWGNGPDPSPTPQPSPDPSPSPAPYPTPTPNPGLSCGTVVTPCNCYLAPLGAYPGAVNNQPACSSGLAVFSTCSGVCFDPYGYPAGVPWTESCTC